MNGARVTKDQIAAAARALSSSIARVDAWENSVTGFGTARDKTTYGAYNSFFTIPDQELSWLYHGDDIAGRIIDVIPNEMLRKGFKVDVGDTNANTAIADKLNALDARGKILEGTRWGRLFGGSALLLGADDGRPAALPLIPERAKDLSFLYVIDRRYIWPLTYYTDPASPKLGQPETYIVAPQSGNAALPVSTVHESRLVFFPGAPTGVREKQILQSWDYSVLQRPYEIIRQFNTSWKAVEVLLTDGNQAIFKMAGLIPELAAGNKDVLKARMEVIDLARSVMRAMVIDAGDGTALNPGESFERQTPTYSGLGEVMDRMITRLAAAAQMPITILMGQSPGGLNATGDSDFRWFYDRIESDQKNVLEPRIRRIVEVFLASKASPLRVPPDAITVTFPALWSEAPAAEATRRLAIAQADAVYAGANILLPEVIALSRFTPEGYSDQTILPDEYRKTLETVLDEELVKLEGTGDEDTAAAQVELAPTDIAKVITVNEARASQGLGKLETPEGKEDPDGELTVEEFTALREKSSISENAPEPPPVVVAPAAPGMPGAKPSFPPKPAFPKPPKPGPKFPPK